MSDIALIKDNVVVNCIVIDESVDVDSLVTLFNVDEVIALADIDTPIGVNWSKVTGSWEPPPRPVVPVIDEDDIELIETNVMPDQG